jgi:hypothetical protein
MFTRGAYALPIAQWGMDQLVSDAVRAALAPALTVKPESFDQQSVYGASLLNADGKLEPSFPGLKPAQDIDAYLVILKFPRPMGMLNVPCPGLGLWNQTGINLEETDLYAHYAIALIDARTLKVIAAHAATMPPDRSPADPSEKAGDSLWPDNPPTLSPDQSAQIRAALKGLLIDSLSETLLHMGLTGKMVADTPPDSAPANVASPSASK